MPVQGLVRARKHQFTRQSALGTAEAATYAFPFSGTPAVNLNWTDPEVDTGSIVTTVAPYRGAADLTAPLNVPALDYDTLALGMCAVFGGGEAPTGGGTAKTWTHKPAAVAPLDDVDVFTYEFGDDVTTDWYQFVDSFVDTLTITGPEGLGACSATFSWRMGGVASTGSTDSPVSGTVPTPGLTVDTNPIYLYMKDLGIYIADTLGGIAGGQLLNALHTFTLTITKEYDQKRWANADQSFDVDEYAVTGYTVALAATLAKTSDTVGTGSESDAWMSDDAVNRVIRLKFTSTVFAEGSTPYSAQFTMPARYYTREEGESGGNSVIVLTANAFYEPDTFAGFFESVIVNQLTEAELGVAAS